MAVDDSGCQRHGEGGLVVGMPVLDDGRDHDPRIIRGRETHEPGMGFAVRILRSPCLSGHRPAREAAAVRGATGLVDDANERIDELLPMGLRQIERPVHTSFREQLVAREVRLDRRRARRKGGVELRHREQGLRVFSLSDREAHDHGFEPAASSVPLVIPLSGVREPSADFGREVDTRGAIEAELDRLLQERVEPDPLSRLVEPDVAGALNRLRQIQPPVSTRQPTAEEAALVGEPARARVRVVGVDREVPVFIPMADMMSFQVDPGGYWARVTVQERLVGMLAQ